MTSARAHVLSRRVVVWLIVKGCKMKIPKEAEGRPVETGYDNQVSRDSDAARRTDAEDPSGASTALEPDDSSKDDAPVADGDEASAAASVDAGGGSPIDYSSR